MTKVTSINDQGVRPLQAKIKAVTEFPIPRFIPNCAESAASLTPLTGGPNRNVKRSIDCLKFCLAKATTLAFPSPDAKLSLMVDASKTAIGAVLNQGQGENRRPLVFFSKALQPTKQRYSTFGRELLAAYVSVKHYAEGGGVLVFRDHKPLISAMSSHSSKYTEREIRQLDFLCQFDLEFRHVRNTVYNSLGPH